MGDTNQSSSSSEKKAPLAPFVPDVLGGLKPPKNVVKPLPNPGQVCLFIFRFCWKRRPVSKISIPLSKMSNLKWNLYLYWWLYWVIRCMRVNQQQVSLSDASHFHLKWSDSRRNDFEDFAHLSLHISNLNEIHMDMLISLSYRMNKIQPAQIAGWPK